MKFVRMFAVLLVAFLMAGCAQDERAYVGSYYPAVTAAKTNCSIYRSTALVSYIILGRSAESAVQSLGFILFSASATLSEAEARAKADEVKRKLDALNRDLEAEKTAAGECFSKRGKEAEKYYWAKGRIAEQRKVVEERLERVLARNKVLEAERSRFERWRAENRKHLVRDVGGMKLEIVRIEMRGLFGQPASKTVITVEATNTTTGKILKPRNQRFCSYEFGSSISCRLSIGASLTDSFGNDYKLTSVTPSFLGIEAGGIRPGQTVTFEVRFGDVPLQNAKSVRLVVAPATFGQRAGTVFELPSEAFYGTVVKR